MMRREDAEKLLDRRVGKYNTRHTHWQDYIFIFSVQDLPPKFLKDNPLIVVHPGFNDYYRPYREYTCSGEYRERHRGYNAYLKRLKMALKDADNTNKPIFIVVPEAHGYKEATDLIIGTFKNMAFIPTIDTTVDISSNVLGVSEEEFYRKLKTHITSAELAGELNGYCVNDFANKLRPEIEVTRIEELIFPSQKQWKRILDT